MRVREYLKQRYAAMLASVGTILLLSGTLFILPLALLLSDSAEVGLAKNFLIPGGCLVVLGLLLRKFFGSSGNVAFSIQEGGIIVLLSWMIVILFSSLPISSITGLPFSRALFESVSGWTTTGLSVVDVTRVPRMILLWRSIIQLAGGAGLAIIMMSAIVGSTGVGISRAEGREDQLVPQVRQSARLVLTIYSGYALAGVIAYWLAGMSVFDAVNHAFAAVSTGGFSTRPESIGFWNSAVVEAVSLPLMFLGNLSFVSAWFLLRGKFGRLIRNSEVRLMAVLVPISMAAVFILSSRAIYPELGKSIRVAVFETFSAVTTTGFSTVGYSDWNPPGLLLLLVLMLIGGGTCSTAGGIKQYRVYLLIKMFFWEIKSYVIPRAAIQVRPIWENGRRVYVSGARIRQVTVFIFMYLITFILGAMVLCTVGHSLTESLFEFASAIGTVGLSLGVTRAAMPDAALWVEMLAMFLGRLEFIVVIVSVIKVVGDGRVFLSSRKKPGL
ncbi:MAG: TrkH family potassium uptake protein [Candidatus Aminicenantes bacterium]|nr:TrkH family potassium uptake protein [Candidatus Aminicenantes bacterium]